MTGIPDSLDFFGQEILMFHGRHRMMYTHHGADTASLDGVSTTLRRGASYGIVGPSGAGKTLLLRAIADLW